MGRAPNYRTFASLSRVNLLHELQQRGPLSMSELTAATGLHHNTTREHLNRLIEAGFVASDEGAPAGRGRPQLRYRTTLTAKDLERAQRLREVHGVRHGQDLVPVTSRSGATPASGRVAEDRVAEDRLAKQLYALVDHLDGCGIDADADDHAEASSSVRSTRPRALGGAGQQQITLRECPYAELAQDHPQVCKVHFGLVKEVLRHAEGPYEAERLDPLQEPNRCTLHLRQSGHS